MSATDYVVLFGLFILASAAHDLGKWLGAKASRRLFGKRP